jgi:uncharacterized membrane-anchored protein YitT (DUF2179 family)
MGLGAFFAAFAIDVFLIPNRLIDGGIVGVSMILAHLFGKDMLPFFLIALNAPFIILAYRSIGKTFVFHMFYSLIVFSLFLFLLNNYADFNFEGESLEVVVIGGAILGIGCGLIIRYGGGLDGTEILGIIVNKRTGFSVGQVVLACNVFIFALAGVVFQDWHPAILSLITYMVVIRVMDSVIIGLDETKSVLIISTKPKQVADAIIHELGLGLTVMYGRGGFSGEEREILYVLTERLQLADLKSLIHRKDPEAFIAIENVHEVSYGKHGSSAHKPLTRVQGLMSKLISSQHE